MDFHLRYVVWMDRGGVIFCYVQWLLFQCVICQINVPQQFVPWDQGQGTTTTLKPNNIVVKIGLGEIRGRKVTIENVYWNVGRDLSDQRPSDIGPKEYDPLPPRNNITVFQFRGIPYATPPVRYLRFKPPQRLHNIFENGIDAYDFKAVCAQDIRQIAALQDLETMEENYPYSTDEDCLYLNVYTTEIERYANRIFPVIVFFHGGNFQSGTANDWPGEVLASKGVVVVTVNYRLGPFGFLSFGDTNGANYGLWDQMLALEWVRDNIYAFSGNPDDVTIMGHGAGAVSVGLHMLNPRSCSSADRHCLFQSAIALGGSELSDLVITNPNLAYNNTLRLGRSAGCAQPRPSEIYSCLLTRSTQDLVSALHNIRYEYSRFPFLPVVDRDFIPDAPLKMLEESRVTGKVPLLTGVNENDGSEALLLDHIMAEHGWKVDNSYFNDRAIDYLFLHNYTENRESILEAIKYQYTYWPNLLDNDRTRDLYMQMASDAFYVAPVAQSAQLHASLGGSVTFMYVNNYRLGQPVLGQPNNVVEHPEFPEWLRVHHDTDIYLIFGFPWMPKELLPRHLKNVQWTDTDRNMSVYFMETVRQFAKKDNPNLYVSEGLWHALDWPAREFWYLDINVTKKSEKNYRWQKVAFWNVYLKQVANLWTTTISPTIANLLWERKVLQGLSGTFILLWALCTLFAATFAYFLFCRRKTDQQQYVYKEMDYQAGTHGSKYSPPKTRTSKVTVA